jgi:hypothetical protein
MDILGYSHYYWLYRGHIKKFLTNKINQFNIKLIKITTINNLRNKKSEDRSMMPSQVASRVIFGFFIL